ncbi:MAG TPA: ATP-binding cassette domain-containing protein [bacterium (Candidatus Stahlbacteria)]|nr:ATP-binding cassette domain-containing protein [Candidatus Stahlbacteria bacterium]
MKAIAIKGVVFTYKTGTKALNGIDLYVNEGEFVALMGKNGAGKTSLSLTLNGIIPKFLKGNFTGSVHIFGVDTKIQKIANLSKVVGLVFQDFESQLFSTSVELEVAFSLENFGIQREEIRKRVDESLALVGLGEYKNRNPATLSGGEKQRLAIASVLAASPSIIVMDEPTTDLDPLGKEHIFAIIKRLQKEKRTIIVVEHETEEVQSADKLIIMGYGKVAFNGKPEDVLKDIELLEQNGIRPIGITCVFKSTLNYEEAKQLVKKGRINPRAYEELVNKDRKALGEPLVEIKNLCHCYEEGTFALSDINLTIHNGEFIAIVGQNGSGKTTLVKHLNGLLYPTKGEVYIKGIDSRKWKRKELAKVVGYVFQNPDHQIFANTVEEEVAFGPKNFGVEADEINIRVKTALKSVGLVGYEEKDPFSLTKGERQRVAVASLLAARPEIIILDEPTTGLDYLETRRMMELIKKLNNMGYTIIIITHAMWVVCEYAHRTIVINDGKIILDGTTREVFSKEEILLSAHIRPPQLVRLSNILGKTLLTADEWNFSFT